METNSKLFLIFILSGSAVETARNFSWLGVVLIAACLFFLGVYAVTGPKVEQQRRNESERAEKYT